MEKVLASAKDSSNGTESMSNDGDMTRRRKANASPSRTAPTEPDYTPEQLEHVKRIKRLKFMTFMTH